MRRVPAWTVAVSEHSHPDFVYVVKDPDTGLALTYEQTVEKWPEHLPMHVTKLMDRLTAVEVAPASSDER